MSQLTSKYPRVVQTYPETHRHMTGWNDILMGIKMHECADGCMDWPTEVLMAPHIPAQKATMIKTNFKMFPYLRLISYT